MNKYFENQIRENLERGMSKSDVLDVLQNLKFRITRNIICEPGSEHHSKIYVSGKRWGGWLSTNSHFVFSFNAADRLVHVQNLIINP